MNNYYVCLVDDDVVELKTNCRILDKSISNLEMKLVAARAERESLSGKFNISNEAKKRKYFMVIGINTAFSSRKRRDSVRSTWMPQGKSVSTFLDF